MSSSVERLVEAFARGLAAGLVAEQAKVVVAPPVGRARGARRRVRRVPSTQRGRPLPTGGVDTAAASAIPPRDASGVAASNGHVPVTFDAGGVVTQAELERLEQVLRGEVPKDVYEPSEGVAPWMGT